MNLPGPFGVSFDRSARSQARRNLRVQAEMHELRAEAAARGHAAAIRERNARWRREDAGLPPVGYQEYRPTAKDEAIAEWTRQQLRQPR